MKLSKKIKKITQNQFVEKMLVSKPAVSKWENGTCYPNINSLKYMSQTFNISLDKILSSEKIIEYIKETLKGNKGFMCQYDKSLNFETV